MKGIKISQGSIIDLELVCGVVFFSDDMLGHLHFGLNNLRVNDLTLLRSSRLSLTVAGMILLLNDYLSLLSSISIM